MKVSKVVVTTGIITGAIALAGIAQPAFAWHPKGVIVKKVQNVTTGSVLSDADTAAQAVDAKPGDTLKYVIQVSNKGDKASNGDNDMATTHMTDTLPAGVELVSSPATRTISEDLGRIKPGQTVTKEYLVKVTANTDGTIENTACFTGDSGANDNQQKGCNPAFVKVTVPETPEVPVTTTPETPETPTPVAETPAELPHTGIAGNVFLGAIALGGVWYVIHRYITSERDLARAWLKK